MPPLQIATLSTHPCTAEGHEALCSRAQHGVPPRCNATLRQRTSVSDCSTTIAAEGTTITGRSDRFGMSVTISKTSDHFKSSDHLHARYAPCCDHRLQSQDFFGRMLSSSSLPEEGGDAFQVATFQVARGVGDDGIRAAVSAEWGHTHNNEVAKRKPCTATIWWKE